MYGTIKPCENAGDSAQTPICGREGVTVMKGEVQAAPSRALSKLVEGRYIDIRR